MGPCVGQAPEDGRQVFKLPLFALALLCLCAKNWLQVYTTVQINVELVSVFVAKFTRYMGDVSVLALLRKYQQTVV